MLLHEWTPDKLRFQPVPATCYLLYCFISPLLCIRNTKLGNNTNKIYYSWILDPRFFIPRFLILDMVSALVGFNPSNWHPACRCLNLHSGGIQSPVHLKRIAVGNPFLSASSLLPLYCHLSRSLLFTTMVHHMRLRLGNFSSFEKIFFEERRVWSRRLVP